MSRPLIKKCRQCGKYKDLEEFDPTGCAKSIRSICMDCISNKASFKARQKETDRRSKMAEKFRLAAEGYGPDGRKL